MNNYDDLFTAKGEKKESKTEHPFNKDEWAAKKQQERTEAFEMLDNATEEAVANPETFRDYLLIQSRFGKYSVSNALLISYQNNEATYLADFETWKEKGVFVQKGEHIRILPESKEYVEFLVGRNGEFDQLVSSTVRRVKRNYRDDNSALVLVLPYLSAEYEKNEEAFQEYYDEVEICQSSSAAHFKAAMQLRNREMVDRSDLVVCYIEHNSGGAFQTVQYAKKKNKEIVNLSDQ